MDRECVDIEYFLAPNKSMILAPAGHGKTHTIVDCLEIFESFENKKILILTHTHAGIASIKEKIKDRNIDSKKYELQTICSFALNLASDYIRKSALPDDSDMSEKYKVSQNIAIRLLKCTPIQAVIKAKYEHLIVDEYQDCDLVQHQLIENLAQIVKVHILGDHMQGIFDFNDKPINLNGSECEEYRKNLQILTKPWRWINAENVELGKDIITIRILLEQNQNIDLRNYSSIEFIHTNKNDIHNNHSPLKKTLRNILNKHYKSNVLIIHPVTHNKDLRVNIIKSLNNLGMIESIDDKDYYETVMNFESKRGQQLILAIISFLKITCAASQISDWFKDDGTLKNKKKDEDKIVMNQIKQFSHNIELFPSPKNILDFINYLQQELECRIIRSDLYHTIIKILGVACSQKISLSEALKNNRDKVRRIGRKIKGKYIGTTLLTKGLECETVMVLDADKFDSSKHLYVALSRCCSRLIVASSSPILSPYKIRKETTKDNNNKTKIIQPSLFEN